MGRANLYSRPRTLDEAVHVLARQAARFCREAPIFSLRWVIDPLPDRVVDISGSREIKGITVETDHIRIGGLTTWSEVVAAPLAPML